MMSQIPCKQSIRIEMTGWFKHYFPGNLRRNFLFKVCNYKANILAVFISRAATVIMFSGNHKITWSFD